MIKSRETWRALSEKGREETRHYSPVALILGMLGGCPEEKLTPPSSISGTTQGPTKADTAIRHRHQLRAGQITRLILLADMPCNSSTSTRYPYPSTLPWFAAACAIGAGFFLLPVDHFSWGTVWYFQNQKASNKHIRRCLIAKVIFAPVFPATAPAAFYSCFSIGGGGVRQAILVPDPGKRGRN